MTMEMKRPAAEPVAPLQPEASLRKPIEEITFGEIFAILWSGRKAILATVMAGLVVAVLWLRIAEPRYTAAVVLAQGGIEDGGGGLLDAVTLPFSLPGGLLQGPAASSPFQQFLFTLHSPRLAERLDREHDLLRILAAARWDEETQSWRPPSGVAAKLKGLFNVMVGRPAYPPPTVDGIASYLGKELLIEEVSDTDFRQISLRHPDPEFAAQLLAWTFDGADQIVRQDALDRTLHYVTYLREQLAQVTNVEHRLTLTELLSEQQKQLMMLQVDLPYAVRVVQPVRVTTMPTEPRPKIVLAMVFLAALLLSCGAVLVYHLALKPNGWSLDRIWQRRRRHGYVRP